MIPPREPTSTNQNVCFMYDGAPHRITTYLGRCIGLGGPTAQPPCFPDINSLDFFFWTNPKLPVYETPVATVEDLKVWIVIASADITNTLNWFETILHPSVLAIL
ncbi:hypothetical protein TNCV_1528301 [Trichonephila clavipes]|nr:hypothetical protein TNCV_1528301 [Trichonephila clavipes]